MAVYHFTGQSEQCTNFVERCEHLDLFGFMPAHVALEVLHQLMLIEGRATGLITGTNPARRLSELPESVRALKECYRDLSLLTRLGITLLDTSRKAVESTSWYCLSYGLLTNDAALLAVMAEHGLDALATADSKLKDIPPFKTYGVSDLK